MSQANGAHRAGGPDGTHLVLQGDAQPLEQLAGYEDHEPGEGDLLPGLCGDRPERYAAEEAATAHRRRISPSARAIWRRKFRRRNGSRGGPQAAVEYGPGRAVEAIARRAKYDQFK